jgi:hypothetical protein
MMLCTVTCSPPTCAAMLAQKFSAATTAIFVLPLDWPAGALPAGAGSTARLKVSERDHDPGRPNER